MHFQCIFIETIVDAAHFEFIILIYSYDCRV